MAQPLLDCDGKGSSKAVRSPRPGEEEPLRSSEYHQQGTLDAVLISTPGRGIRTMALPASVSS